MQEGHRENIKVSVVMPVLNGMPYFKEALTSVLNQTLEEMEILVIDAGSTDGTIEYISEMQSRDRRLRLISSDKKSMGRQYNLGIREAKGEYIGFCEADDYLETDMFETLYAAAEKQDKPETVKGDIHMFIEKQGGGEFTLYYHILPPEARKAYGKIVSMQDIPDLYMRDVNMWNGIFRRDFLLEKEVSLNETPGASYQDTDFVQQVNMLAKRQLFVQQAFYHYRRDNEGSSMYKKNASVYVMKEFEYMLRFCEKHTAEKNLFFVYMLERMVWLFASFYGKDLYWNQSTEYDDELERFIAYLRMALQKSTPAQKSQLERLYKWSGLYALLQSAASFRDMALEKYSIERKNIQGFYEYIHKEKEIVIFGAGETGQNLLAFLTVCGYQGSVVFCDNAADAQNRNVMGCRVMAVADTCREHPLAVYCVPNYKYYTAMQTQLLGEGICADRIILSPPLTAHTSMEMKGLVK